MGKTPGSMLTGIEPYLSVSFCGNLWTDSRFVFLCFFLSHYHCHNSVMRNKSKYLTHVVTL